MTDVATLGLAVDTRQVAQASKDLGSFTQAGAAAETQTTKLTKATDIFSAAVKGLAAGWAALKVTQYVKDAALLQARYETLGVVLNVVGRNAGYLTGELDKATRALQAQGISMVESRQQTTRLIQAHIDLSNASKLARIAQDAAVIANINSSEAFATLVHGIQSGQTEVLRNIGLNVSMEQSYKQIATQLGKNVDALTQNERIQGVLNSVMRAGADIAGTYEAAMDTAGKQLTSMKRYTEDLKVIQGETFNEILVVAVMAFTEHLKDSNREVRELAQQGELKAWGEALTDVFAAVADNVNNALAAVKLLSTYAAYAATGVGNFIQFQKDQFTLDPAKAMKAYKDYQTAQAANAKLLEETKKQILATEDRFSRAVIERRKANAEREQKSAAQSADKELQRLEAQQAARTKILRAEEDRTTVINKPGSKGKTDHTAEKQYDLQVEQLQNILEQEKLTYQFRLDLLESYHRAGITKDEDYYVGRKTLLEANEKAELEFIDKQIDALEKLNEAQAKRADYTTAIEAEVNKKFEDLYGKRTTIIRKAAHDKEMLEVDAANKAYQATVAQSEAISREVGAIYEQVDALKLKIQTYGQSADAVTHATIAQLEYKLALLETSDWEGEATKAVKARIEALQALEKAQREETAVEREANRFKEIWSSVDQTAKSVFTNIFNGGKDAFTRLRDTLKSTLLDLLYQMTVRKWVFNIAANVTGASGSAIQAVSGGGGGGGSDLLGLGTNILGAGGLGTSIFGAGGLGGALMGGAGWLTGSTTLGGALSAAGSLIGTSGGLGAGLAMGAGALAPIALGAYLLSGMLDSGPEENTTLSFGSSRNRVSGSTSTGRRQTGGNFVGGAGVNTSFGSFGVTDQFWMDALASQNRGKLDTFLTVVKQSDQALSNLLTDAERLKVVSNLDNSQVVARTGPEGSDPSTQYSAVFLGRLKNIFTSLDSSLGALLDGVTGDINQIAAEATVLLSAYKNLDQISRIVGETVTLPQLGALRRDSESLSQTLARLVPEFENVDAALKLIGKNAQETFGAVGLASIAAREKLVAAFGSVDQFSTVASSFEQNFYTESERATRQAELVGQQMAALGYASVTTKEQFRKLIEGFQITDDSSAKTFAGLLGVSDAFAQVANYAASATQAVTSAASGIGDFDAAQKALADARQNLIADAENAFASLSRSIQAEKDRLQKEYDDKRKQLTDAASTASESLQSAKSVFDMLSQTTSGVRPLSRTAAEDTLRRALASGSVTEDVTGLQNALGVLSQTDSRKFASALDMQREQARTANLVSSLRDKAGAQVSVAQLTLDAVNKSIEQLDTQHQESIDKLDKQLEIAQQQLDVLKGIDNSVLTVAEAIAQFGQAAGAASAPVSATDAVSQLYKTILGREGDTKGVNYWAGQVESGAQSLGQVASQLQTAKPINDAVYGAYASFAGKSKDQVDEAGLQYWVDRAYAVGIDQMQKELEGSVKAIRGYSTGGDHPGGWAWFGEAGPELVQTGPATVVNSSNSRKMMQDNADVADLLRELVSTLGQQGSMQESRDIAIITRLRELVGYAKRWDLEGLTVKTAEDQPLEVDQV